MSETSPEQVYRRTLALLKPALERVVRDREFRARLEDAPLEALAEVGVELDEATREELRGRRFSEFWADRRAAVEGPVQVRDLPPDEGSLEDEQLDAVSGGVVLGKGPVPSFAPPYVPVGPVVASDTLSSSLDTTLDSDLDSTKLK